MAGGPTRQAGFSKDVAALTANLFSAATKRTKKTKQGRLDGPLSSLPK